MTIIEAINDTARSLSNLSKVLVAVAEKTEGVPAVQAVTVDAKEEPKKETKKTEAKETPTEPKKEETVTLEMVRSVLAEKSQAGLTDKVKSLLESFGAAKLSAVKSEDYAKLMAAAKEIGRASCRERV